MSTYKVIQDIEAEDKILGPLTLKQFIAGLVAAFFGYLCFISVAKGASWALAILAPPMLLAVFFAFPFGKDQPTEVWAAAKFQFLFKPRRRIWDQSGMKELVTITVPKKIEHVYTDGLSQTEVRSRLSALASTIDSRGWAVKGVGAATYSQGLLFNGGVSSDRLVSVNAMPQAVPDFQVPAYADVLDSDNSPVAQQFTQMITASQQAHRQDLMDQLNGVRAAVANEQPQWFTSPQAGAPAQASAQPIDQSPTANELEILERVKANNSSKQLSNSHLRTLQPIGAAQPVTPIQQTAAATPQPVTPAPDPAILSLANNNDLNIATLAREANKAKTAGELDNGEVVVSLR